MANDLLKLSCTQLRRKIAGGEVKSTDAVSDDFYVDTLFF
jgi:hypothetical protein